MSEKKTIATVLTKIKMSMKLERNPKSRGWHRYPMHLHSCLFWNGHIARTEHTYTRARANERVPHIKTEINNHNIWIKYPPNKLFAFKTSVERSINYKTKASFVCICAGVGGCLCVCVRVCVGECLCWMSGETVIRP